MAYDSARGKGLLFGGFDGGVKMKDSWEWAWLADGRVGQTLQVPFFSARASSLPPLKEINATFYAGGVGYPAGIESFGTDLMVWNTADVAWQTVASNADSFSSPDIVQWSTNDPSVMMDLFDGSQLNLNFAVTPSAPNGTGSNLGQVAVDYAEVTVKYRLP